MVSRTFRIPADLYAQLEVVARKEKISVNELVIRSISFNIANDEFTNCILQKIEVMFNKTMLPVLQVNNEVLNMIMEETEDVT